MLKLKFAVRELLKNVQCMCHRRSYAITPATNAQMIGSHMMTVKTQALSTDSHTPSACTVYKNVCDLSDVKLSWVHQICSRIVYFIANFRQYTYAALCNDYKVWVLI